MLKGYRSIIAMSLMVLALLVGGVAFSAFQSSPDAYANASVDGSKNQANVRALIGSTDRVRRIVYFKMENHATGGANTPVASGAVCDLAGKFHYAEVKLSGTLTGAAPTLVIKWQNSMDNGSTWTDVGTWTTINATVTPAVQKQTVADHVEEVLMNANTPVVTPAVMYGDCWRALYTMGAAGAGNFSMIGAEK